MDIGNIFNTIGDWFYTVGEKIIGFFPTSPFAAITQNSDVAQVLGWLNWFIPISQMLAIMQAWLACVAVYYVWQLLARWVKLIE